MTKQLTFTDEEYGAGKRTGRREKFLTGMNELVPRGELVKEIEPYYPQSGRRGRQPLGIETMLRMYFLQVWFNLADEALEETIYGSYAMKKFMQMDFCEEAAPDAAALLKFRHLLEGLDLQERIFKKVNELLEKEGKMMRGGTIIDAAILESSSSAGNSAKSRDPEMKPAKKGNEWHFGMKARIGADAGTGMAHSAEVTGANVSDIQTAYKLVRADDNAVDADAGYIGIEKREEVKKDEHLSGVEWRI